MVASMTVQDLPLFIPEQIEQRVAVRAEMLVHQADYLGEVALFEDGVELFLDGAARRLIGR